MIKYAGVLFLAVMIGIAGAGTYTGGLGTEASPYQISTVADWLELIDTEDDWDKHFELTNDIDFEGVELMPVGAPDWDIYSNVIVVKKGFEGVFEGGGFDLRNFIIDYPDYDYIGLFGYIEGGGQVKNLNLENGYISGRNYVGGLVGLLGGYGSGFGVPGGVISNCNYSGSIASSGLVAGGLAGGVYSGTIENSHSISSVSGQEYLGGLVGYIESATMVNITYCYATGDVFGSSIIGGLVGDVWPNATINGCFATGDVSGSISGGLAGRNYGGKIIHCYSTGRPSGGTTLGGLVGTKTTGGDYEDTGNFWDTETSQIATSAMGVGKTTAEMQTNSTFTSAGWDFETVWAMPAGGGYPILQWQIAAGRGSLQVFILPQSAVDDGAQWRLVGTETWLDSGDILDDLFVGRLELEFKPGGGLVHPSRVMADVFDGQLTTVEVTYKPPYSGGSGTVEDPFEIETVSDWLELTQTEVDWDKHFVLLNDLDFQGIVLAPIGWFVSTENQLMFDGTLDGRGHVLQNVFINLPDSDFVGLFGAAGRNSFIRNLGLENVNVTGQGSVGGLCGVTLGMIDNCFVAGEVRGINNVGGLCGSNENGMITASHSAASVDGDNNAGSLCGVSWGKITDCYATGAAATFENAGGLCGINLGTITDCYATGAATATYNAGGLCGQNRGTVSNSHATGAVTVSEHSGGGLCGLNVHGGIILSCYATGRVSGTQQIGGLCGTNALSGSRISNSYATGRVSGADFNIGGLCGTNYSGIITASYSTSWVSGVRHVGGLTGENYYGIIHNSYAKGTVTGTAYYIAGLCGINDQGSIRRSYSASFVTAGASGGIGHGLCGSNNSTIEHCFWDKDVAYAVTTSAGGTAKTTLEMKTLSTFINATWDFTNEVANGASDFWRMCADGVDYPRLNWQGISGDFSCGDGVGMEDLIHYLDRWLMGGCVSGNNYCGGADLDYSGKVDLKDLAVFAENWLE